MTQGANNRRYVPLSSCRLSLISTEIALHILHLHFYCPQKALDYLRKILLDSQLSKNACVEERVTDSRTAIDIIVVDDRNIAICDEMRNTTVDSNENQDKERKTNKLEEGTIQIESLLIKNNPSNSQTEKCNRISLLFFLPLHFLDYF